MALDGSLVICFETYYLKEMMLRKEERSVVLELLLIEFFSDVKE